MMAAPEALVGAESVPHAPGSQWERDQDTPLFCGSLATLAVRLCVCASWIVVDAGETLTLMAAAGTVMAMAAEADYAASAMEVAVTMTEVGAGTCDGAV